MALKIKAIFKWIDLQLKGQSLYLLVLESHALQPCKSNSKSSSLLYSCPPTFRLPEGGNLTSVKTSEWISNPTTMNILFDTEYSAKKNKNKFHNIIHQALSVEILKEPCKYYFSRHNSELHPRTRSYHIVAPRHTSISRCHSSIIS